MRGLTPAERHALTCPIGVTPKLAVVEGLAARALVVFFNDHRGYGYGVEALGKLALRLDAAARAAGLVSA